MTDIVEEAMNDKRDEQKAIYFRRALPIVLIMTIITILAMTINNYRNDNIKSHNQEIGDTVIKALENLQHEPTLTLEALDFVTKQAESNTQDIAALQLLALNISGKNFDKALEIIDNVLASKKSLNATKAYARLMWISIKLDSKELTEQDTEKMKQYFSQYTENVPFYGSARMLEALWCAGTDGQKAIKILQDLLANKMVTSTIKEEARALMSNLMIENQ